MYDKFHMRITVIHRLLDIHYNIAYSKLTRADICTTKYRLNMSNTDIRLIILIPSLCNLLTGV